MEHEVTGTRMLTAKDIQEIFMIGKNTAYELMNSKGFPTLRINNRLYVSQSALNKWIETYSGKKRGTLCAPLAFYLPFLPPFFLPEPVPHVTYSHHLPANAA
jgi:predicted DNA-binding transcriptional regulator AlpA